MGNSVEKLEKNKIEFIKGLELEELKTYIENLINTYYESYISGDSKSLKNNIEEINLFIDDFSNIYPNISNYINSRMLYISNKVLEEILKNENLKLYYPDDVDIRGTEINHRNLFDDDLMKKILTQEEEAKCNRCRKCQE